MNSELCGFCESPYHQWKDCLNDDESESRGRELFEIQLAEEAYFAR